MHGGHSYLIFSQPQTYYHMLSKSLSGVFSDLNLLYIFTDSIAIGFKFLNLQNCFTQFDESLISNRFVFDCLFRRVS